MGAIYKSVSVGLAGTLLGVGIVGNAFAQHGTLKH